MSRGLLPLVAAVAAGCHARQQVVAEDVDPAAWHTVTFAVENTDTAALRDLAFFLRCDDRFAEDTLTLRVVTLSPDSMRCEEPLLLAARAGADLPLRNGERIVPYRQSSRLGRCGLYRFTVAPCRPVRGVESVGIRISSSKQQ